MRILHVLNTGKYSGAENVVITLIRALTEDAECAYASPDGPIAEILKEQGIRFYPVKTLAMTAWELKKIIKEFSPDIVHAHDYNAGIRAILTGTKRPILNHLHNNTPWLREICPRSIVYGASCLKYRKILTVSDSVMEDFIFGKYLSKKSIQIGNPINVKSIRDKAEEASIKDPSDVIFLGRLSSEKNPLFFIEIAKKLIAMLPDLKIAMVGTGEMRSEVERKLMMFDLEKNIKLYGFQKNPYGLLKNSKVQCMPSEWEGFGLAAVEGLAFGKPVVAAAVGGLKDIVNDDCGKLCTDIDDYVQEIYKLLCDGKYYANKSKGSSKRAELYDNIKTYRKRLLAIYKSFN